MGDNRGSRWVGKVFKKKIFIKIKIKIKPGGGGEKIKFQKIKTEIRGKKNWEGGGEKIKLQKKLRSGAEKGQTKNSQAGMAQG